MAYFYFVFLPIKNKKGQYIGLDYTPIRSLQGAHCRRISKFSIHCRILLSTVSGLLPRIIIDPSVVICFCYKMFVFTLFYNSAADVFSCFYFKCSAELLRVQIVIIIWLTLVCLMCCAWDEALITEWQPSVSFFHWSGTGWGHKSGDEYSGAEICR